MAELTQRRRPRKVTHEEVGLQIAPMIDVTMLLLFFFMLSGKLTKSQKLININLPRAEAAVVPEDLSGRDVVNIDEKGQYIASEKKMDLRELKAYLKQRLIEVPPLIIYVRADAKTPAKQIKDVMKACAEAGAIQVIFGTTQH